jgi:putative tricarboxylic transport membrane protein
MENLFSHFVGALANFARLDIMITIILAVVFATIGGIIPGISNGIMCALALPFIFGMNPLIALVLLCAMTSATSSGGSLSAIVIGIPGTPSSAATLIDGFAMTQKGEGGRAIGAALMSASLGAIFSIALAFLMIPIVMPLVMEFRAPEMFLMVLTGLCFVIALVRGKRIRGFISACLGLLFSFVGTQGITGAARFTFNTTYLYSGLDLLVAMLGLFAVPVVVTTIVSGKPIISSKGLAKVDYSDVFQGVLDVFRHWGVWLRAAIVGYIVGVIPGIGGEVATWASYGQAKYTSKTSEKYGTGCIEGVIAPEAAQNAKEGGDLLTTLAFGIPGGGIMAFFLAAFMIVGIQPGPKMLLEHTTLCFTMLLTVAIANVLGCLLCLAFAKYVLKIAALSPVYLFAGIMPLLCVGCYASNSLMLDLIVMLAFGIMGVFMDKYGYSMPALILGFILGNYCEYYFWHSLDIFGPIFFKSPISIVLLTLIILMLGKDLFMLIIKKMSRSLKAAH